MTKAELFHYLETCGLDDDTPVYVVDSKTRYPAKIRWFNNHDGGYLMVVRDRNLPSPMAQWNFSDE